MSTRKKAPAKKRKANTPAKEASTTHQANQSLPDHACAPEDLPRPSTFCFRELDDLAWPPRHSGVRCHGFHDQIKAPRLPAVPKPLPEVTEAKQRLFLSAFAMCGSLRGAARISGVPRSSHYEWKEGDADYKTAFEQAKDEYADVIDEEMHERGIVGWDEPQIGRVGQFEDGVVTYVRKKDTQVLLALARGVRPEKYNRQRHEVTGADGEAIKIDPTKLNDAQLVQLREIVAAVVGAKGES